MDFKMYTKTYFGAVILVIYVAVVPNIKADVDCNQRPSFVDPKECCPVQNLISEELFTKCKEQLNMRPPPPEGKSDDDDSNPPPTHGPPGHHHPGPHGHHGHNYHCLPSCFFNETGILEDGELNENNLEMYLNEAVADTPDIIPVFKEAFQVCYEKAEEIMQRIREHFEKQENGPPKHVHGPPHRHCSPREGIMFRCAMMNTFKACPDSIWTGTEECNTVRDYFNECMPAPEDDEV